MRPLCRASDPPHSRCGYSPAIWVFRVAVNSAGSPRLCAGGKPHLHAATMPPRLHPVGWAERSDALILLTAADSHESSAVCTRRANQQNLSSPPAKNISPSLSGKSVLPARAISSPKRGVGHRHERGMGCGGRGSVGAQVCSQGGFRERAPARRTNGAGYVRQNRVVPTPVAGVKFAEAKSPNRAGLSPSIRGRR
jgi:hypothetical protein